MSLIQDALKRQKEEFGDGGAGGEKPDQASLSELRLRQTESGDDKDGGPAPPSSPEPVQEEKETQAGQMAEGAQPAPVSEQPPVPEEPEAAPSEPVPEEPEAAPSEPVPEKKSKSKVWLTMLGVTVFLVIVVGAVVYLVMFTLSWVRKKSGEQLVAAVSVSEQAAEVIRTVPDTLPAQEASRPVTPPESSQPSAETAGPPEHEPAPVQPPEGTARSEDTKQMLARPVLAEEERSESPVAPEPKQMAPDESEPSSEPPVVEELPPMDWPVLKLSAVLSGLGSRRDAARINDKMVPVGGEIEGVTLINVKAEGVMLKYGHETRFLRMGASIY